MYANLIACNWQTFVHFVELHEKDLIIIKKHIETIMKSVHTIMKTVISKVTGRIKEIFIEAYNKIQKYALPATIVAVGVAVAIVGIATQIEISLPFKLVIEGAWPVYEAFGFGVVGTLMVLKGIEMCKERLQEEEERRVEKIFVDKVGLRYTCDRIDELVNEIEDKKFWEEDHQKNTRPYRDCERKIKELKKQIEKCMKLN